MRLVTKLMTLLMLGICTVLVVDGALTVKRELRMFDEDMRSDARVFGKMLSRMASELRATHGDERAMELIDSASAMSSTVVVRWVWLSGSADHAPRVAGVTAQELERETIVARVLGKGASGVLYTYVAVPGAGRRGAALELAEPLRPKHEYTQATVRRTAVLIGVTLTLCSVMALLLGAWIVGRPIRRLVARARAIGAGDLRGTLTLRQRDELGQLACEINDMSESLLAAQERIASESAARVRAVEQLRHADRLATVGTLAAGVAHELGTPLNIVAERARMIENASIPPQEFGENARIVREQAERMAAIIRQLLDFARRRSVTKLPLDVADIVQVTAELLQAFAAKKNISLRVRDDCDGRDTVELDGEQIQQALANLVMNAIHAADRGGAVEISLAVETATPPAGHSGRPGQYVVVSVSDNGAGIADADLPHIFEPFFTTKDIGDGTGLGLSVTYGIVRDHGGWIDVASAVGEGSLFRVFLPVESAV